VIIGDLAKHDKEQEWPEITEYDRISIWAQ
jgi:hypothetical protein